MCSVNHKTTNIRSFIISVLRFEENMNIRSKFQEVKGCSQFLLDMKIGNEAGNWRRDDTHYLTEGIYTSK